MVLALSLAIAAIGSYVTISWSSQEAAKVANSIQFKQEELEALAKETGLSIQQLQSSFEQTQKALNNPQTYPGFNQYWLKSFLIWLPLCLVLFTVPTWLLSSKK